MQQILNLFKPIGVTPLELIEAYRQKHPEYSKSKLGYAGRLDPMAEGVLLVLVDEENKKRKSYEQLEKSYIFTVLFGIETDTYDILGKITNSTASQSSIANDEILKILPNFTGSFSQPYPIYSSRTVNGKPLYYWARNDKLDSIAIPHKVVNVTDIRLLTNDYIPLETIQREIMRKLQLVKGDFRQKEITEKWHNYFHTTKRIALPIAEFSVTCSSGTYVRAIAHQMGKLLGRGGLAFSIHRTAVGEFAITESMRLFD